MADVVVVARCLMRLEASEVPSLRFRISHESCTFSVAKKSHSNRSLARAAPRLTWAYGSCVMDVKCRCSGVSRRMHRRYSAHRSVYLTTTSYPLQPPTKRSKNNPASSAPLVLGSSLSLANSAQSHKKNHMQCLKIPMLPTPTRGTCSPYQSSGFHFFRFATFECSAIISLEQ
jgi:hypothetical protein